MSYSKVKMHQILRPDPTGELQRSPTKHRK